MQIPPEWTRVFGEDQSRAIEKTIEALGAKVIAALSLPDEEGGRRTVIAADTATVSR